MICNISYHNTRSEPGLGHGKARDMFGVGHRRGAGAWAAAEEVGRQ